MKHIPTGRCRWDRRLVIIPPSLWWPWQSSEYRWFLQLWWIPVVRRPRKATQKDVDAGNAAFVGSAVKMDGEWRDIGGTPEQGFKL